MEAVKDPDSRRDQTIERLITQHQTSLLRLCYVQLQDQALAEDAVQETFLKAYKGFDSFRGDSSEKTWLTRIAVNTCRDFQRGGWFKHTDRRVTPDMLPTEEIAETLGIAQSSVSNRLRRGREKLRKLLEGRDQDA